MKRRNLLVVFLFFVFLSGCSSGKPLQESDITFEEEKFLDLQDFHSWDNSGSGTYDAQTHKVSISKQYSAVQIWFNKGFDASAYNYLKIDYENASHSFNLSVTDSSGKEALLSCSKYKNTVYIPLHNIKTNSIRKVVLMRMNKDDDFSVIIKNICFTKNQNLPDPEVDNGITKKMNDISAIKLVQEMKAGWCLGLTLDANGDWLPKNSLDSEICWGEEYTTKEIIGIGMNNGFKTIRIPATWFNHIIDDEYTIDGDWMRRVKTVVDWAIEQGYYVFINTSNCIRDNMNKPLKHGDGYIVRNDEKDIAESKAFLNAVWTQIATAFNNSYDEHLIFETMNEPRNTDHEHIWQPGLKLDWVDNSECKECLADYRILNEYNKVCLDAIRSTGGNNADRFVMIPSLGSGIQMALHDAFELPEDSAKDKLILVVHDYRLGVSAELAKKSFTDGIKSEMDKEYKALSDRYISKGIPVIAGEVGATHSVPLEERVKWISYFGKLAKQYGMSIVTFEAGGTGENEFSIFDRKNLCLRPEDEAFAYALVNSFK